MDSSKRMTVLALGFGLLGIGGYRIYTQCAQHACKMDGDRMEYMDRCERHHRHGSFRDVALNWEAPTSDPRYQTMMAKQFAVQPNEWLAVDVPIGDVVVETADIQEARIEVRMAAQDELLGRAFFQDMKFSADRNGKTVRITSSKDVRIWNRWNGQNGDARFQIVVLIPKSFNIQLMSGSGNLSVADLEGSAQLWSQAGDIVTNNIQGAEIKVQTAAGDVQMGNLKGRVRIESKAGDVRLGKVEAHDLLSIFTEAGDIEAGTLSAAQISIQTAAGNISVTDIAGDTDIRSLAGNINIAHMSGHLEAATETGDVQVKVHECEGTSVKSKTGDIDIEMPAGSGVQIHAEGNQLDVSGSFAFEGRQNDRMMQGEMNGGGVVVNVSATEGAVQISMN